jgi:16S rRNA (guanine527-N7)-methyltransferase
LNFELIIRYFPGLTAIQQNQFRLLGELYPEWNEKINVISRKDIENLYERHVLHSLGIAKAITFKEETRILDAGTGGGFPGIPLAVLFPQAHFHLVDSTAKKLAVVDAVARETGLKNVSTEHCRFEDHRVKYDFIVSRAVASLETMFSRLKKNIHSGGSHPLPNGILYLKGGDFSEELTQLSNYKIYKLSDYFSEPYFETKSLVHLF